MSTAFASGRHALGDCDVCGGTYRLRELREVYVKLKKTNLLACPDCWDPDHPQLQQGMYPIYDPQALRNPRPDLGVVASRDFQWGWNPVGGGNAESLTPNDLVATGGVGDVTVTT